MSEQYFIIYNPLTYNLMDLLDDRTIKNKTPIHMISYLTNLNGSKLRNDNYLDYLDFDPKKHREGMVETFAIESYAALYIGNQIAKFASESKVIHADGKHRTVYQVIKREVKKPKAVFITTMSSNFPTAVAISIILNYGKIPVIIGGIHVSTSPEDVKIFIRKYCPHPELVIQVIGAGDSSVIPQILNDLQNKTLKPEYRGFNIIEDKVWEKRPNVDYLKPMKFDYLKRIPILGWFFANKIRIIPVSPFLGCPYSCNFCSISTLPKNQRKFTIRSANDFLDELEYLQKSGNFDSRFFLFLPDNLLLGGSNLEAILDGIIERELKVNFSAQISIDVASNEKLLKKLRLAGATHFFIGLETLDIRNLKYIGKHIVGNVRKSGLSLSEYYAKQIRRINNYGISIHGAFIFGLPYDYFNSFQDNTGKEIEKFCIENHIGLQPCSLTDLPGSITFRESQESGTWLYGKQGAMGYLIALCLTDLTETNRRPPDSLDNSALKIGYMSYESIKKIGSLKIAFINALYIMWKSFCYPTDRGRRSLKERFIDSTFSFISQIIVSLYKDHGEKIAYSKSNIRGAFERLFELEKNPEIKKTFRDYVKKFKYNSETEE